MLEPGPAFSFYKPDEKKGTGETLPLKALVTPALVMRLIGELADLPRLAQEIGLSAALQTMLVCCCRELGAIAGVIFPPPQAEQDGLITQPLTYHLSPNAHSTTLIAHGFTSLVYLARTTGAPLTMQLIYDIQMSDQERLLLDILAAALSNSLNACEYLVNQAKPLLLSSTNDMSYKLNRRKGNGKEDVQAEGGTKRHTVEEILEHMPAAVAVIDPATLVIRHANSSFQRLLVSTKDQAGSLVGVALDTLAPSSLQQTFIEAMRKVGATGQLVVQNDVMLEPGSTGSLLPTYWDIRLAPLPGDNERVQSVLALAIEITEQARAQQRIETLAREAEQHASELRAIIETMTEAVAVTDVNTYPLMMNRSYLSLLGVEQWPEAAIESLEAQVQLLNIRRLDGTPITSADLPVSHALQGETVDNVEFLVHPAQSVSDVTISVSAAPIRNEVGEVIGTVTVARDISELKVIERLKDQLIAIVSHELKTPLSSVSGYTQLVQRSLSTHQDLKQENLWLDTVRQQCKQLTVLIDGLLDISHLESGTLPLKREWIDIGEVAIKEVERLRATGTACTIHMQFPGDEMKLPPVQGDRDRMRQIFANLLSNLANYTFDGGSLTLSFTVSPVLNTAETFQQSAPAELHVSFINNGWEIEPKELETLFARFYRASNPSHQYFQDIGLSLYITRLLIEAHGGRIWIKNTPGQGSTFSFALPLS